MRDKMIRDRLWSGGSVDASVETHIDDVVDPLGANFGQHLVDGEVLPDLRIVLRILQRMLAAEIQNLAFAGTRHLREIDNDIKLRQRRDELVTVLGTKVRGLRNTLEGLFGPRSAQTMAGIDGRTEQEPVALLQQVANILDRFGDPDGELAEPGFGAQLDPAAVVADFQSDYQELRDLVTELNRENRKSDSTIIAKNEAMTRYDQHFRWIAGCLESLYHLAGQHDLAERVKPSTRRPGRTEADVEAEESESSGDPPESEGSGDPPETDGSEATG